MIKYKNNTIFDWNYDTSNVIKVYRNNAIVFYKVSVGSPTPQYKVCFAVVDDITKYQETEFEDVYDKATKKWYKLNNLNQYEEYGSYGSGRSVTTYKGKLTIDEGYEYEWNGSEWVNLGEVTVTTATLPDVPFTVNYNAKNYDASTQTFAKTEGQLADTDVTITGETLTAHDGYVTVPTNSRGVISGYGDYFNRTNSTPNLTIISKQRTEGENCHMFANRISSSFNWMYRPYSNRLTLHGGSEQGEIAVTTQPVIESVRIDSNRLATYNNYTDNISNTKSNFSYNSSINGSVALFAGYTDISGEWFVGDFYWIYMSQNTLTDEQVQQVINYNEIGGKSEYPKYYSEKSDPLNDLAFNTLVEAQTYAKANCVYDGMRATINGDRYYFDSTNENGWVKILEYYKVEDVTTSGQGGSGWTVTNSDTYNPNKSYYDDFSTASNSSYYQYKVAKVTIYGYENFTYYLRSSGSSYTCYAVATNIDELQSDPETMGYDSDKAITNTYDFRKAPKSDVNLDNYRRITYNNLDKTVEHTFYVLFYNGYDPNNNNIATILIPKYQDNENWEQVTFSASSNVASSYKYLYIDGTYDKNGGTNYFYYRWMVGLPSGSHSSNTNYSNYNYCPNVTSSTFTSVAGGQRQVNFTYDDTTNKILSFRLVDGNGNLLTPSDTVYYKMTLYNSCNTSDSFSTSLPSRQYVKVGGSFYFSNSSNRHYIYGYEPPTLGTRYYSDDYQDTFDIVYTKLNDEAVTITYTTYDPNDSETPAFKTDITYPYGGGTTSSTTLTSFDVPYTYLYKVNTIDKFSADSQSYTAGQTTRTINFVLYPNNREFSTVADMEAYTYAWEGMNANVGNTKYKYKNGEWVEEAYTQYEYIQTQTGNYRYDFNTNFYPTTENTIEVKFTFTGDSIDWGRFICWSSCDGDSCDSTQFRFTTVTSNYAIIARKGNSRGLQFYSIGNGETATVVMPLSSTTYTYNIGSTNTTCNYNSGEFSLPSTTPMHIFNLGYASDNIYAANVRLHYVKVYDGSNNLVKHYVPSYNNGTPCLYEIVDGEYIMDTYTSSNHGTLTLGPEL